LELQPELAELARRNAAENGRGSSFRVITGDLSAPPLMLAPHAFDGVFMNPPYQRAAAGRASPQPTRALAASEGALGLADWLAAALRLLKPKGRLTLIHRADRLPELLRALEGRIGAIAVLPLFPGDGRAAKRILLTGIKDSRAPFTLLPGLTLHDAEGAFTPEAEAILREGGALKFGC
jgi:tRNA1(Val) A37 N6-methylase TrmN6